MPSYPVTVTVSSTSYLSDSFLEEILVTAFEGGINYWCEKVGRTSESKFDYNSEALAFDGVPLKLWVMEECDEEGNDLVVTLSRTNLLTGIKLYCEAEDILPVTLEEDVDADVADQIVQYALFGEVVYG